ncbi:hypothetical protein H6P81_010587 [Aristolochia fimbriata]|uniref:Uncharacterized protein n=1 Tax=Aristolochia fimbriata TaxID=158543 RepID=A0AAV7EP70_ARIFI|nr:hypothetical protein H6P81_010587 [Aristolochia fimbriata]
MEKQEKEEQKVKKDQRVYIDIDKLQAINDCNEAKRWARVSIYKVPPQVANLNPTAYKPQIVSIGPYHNGEPQLMPMEEHKYRALYHVLRRSERDLDDFLGSLREVAQELMLSYEEIDPEWRDEERFLELMLLDGCFVLEVLRASGKAAHDYCSNDPVFSVRGMLSAAYYILPDLLKVENQLPLLALEKIVSVERCTDLKPYEYILALLRVTYNCTNCNTCPVELGKCLHILDMTRRLKIGGSQEKMATVLQGLKPKPMKGATQLTKAGIIYRRSDEPYNFSEIKFQNGILYLPIFHLSPATESVLLNYVAFERLHPGSGQEISSYVRFMDGLTRSVEDAKLLASRGIIISASGSFMEVKDFIHKIHRDMNFVPKDNLYSVQHMIEAYYWERTRGWSRRFRDWGVHFKERYFKNPWSLIALLAAVFLLGLTIDQTIFTNLSFYKSR